jgi:hypothetical protein
MLKEVPCKSEEKEVKVNIIQGERGWRTPKDTTRGWRWKKPRKKCSL